MGKGSFFGVLLIAFVVWVVIAQNNEGRIERTCRPVGWLGNVSVSIAALVGTRGEATVQNVFDRFSYGCEYTAWRLVFESQYLDIVRAYVQQTGHQRLSLGDVSIINGAARGQGIAPPPATVAERQAKRLAEKAREVKEGYNFEQGG